MRENPLKEAAVTLALLLVCPGYGQQTVHAPDWNPGNGAYRFVQHEAGALNYHWLDRKGEIKTMTINPAEVVPIIVEFTGEPALLHRLKTGDGMLTGAYQTRFTQFSNDLSVRHRLQSSGLGWWLWPRLQGRWWIRSLQQRRRSYG